MTFVQTSDHCTGSCGIDAGNVINVTYAGANVTDITVTLASGWTFVDTGANGTGGTVNFGLTSPSSLTFTPVTPNAFSTTNAGWQVQGGAPAPTGVAGATQTASSAAIAAPGKFSFTNGFALTCNTSGASSACSSPLDFRINLSLASVLAALATSDGAAFWLDVFSRRTEVSPA